MDSKLGRYKILRLLARGGVAEVFLGRLDGPGGFTRPVVVKRLKPAYRLEPTYRRALIAEARVGALLNHPNILQYLELVEENDEIFVVTDYLHGVTARELIRTVAAHGDLLPIPVALHAVAEVLDGLHYAHTAMDDRGSPLNIVHRDISPENVFFCDSGAVKVMDFGIARTSIGPRDTQVHMIKGKARYFSPEQAQGQPIGATSDVFAMGLLLFELLSNVPAIDAEDERSLVERARAADIPDVRTIRSDVPESVARILVTALNRNPAKRFPTALAMMREVRTALNKLSPRFTVEDLRSVLRERFEGDLESKRRQIWSDRATAVVNAAVAMSADLPRVRRASAVTSAATSAISNLYGVDTGLDTDTVTEESGSRAIKAAVEKVEKANRAGRVPRPRYSPELVEDFRAVEPLDDEPPTEPLSPRLREQLARQALNKDQNEPTEDAARQANLERLRRAITEAYDD